MKTAIRITALGRYVRCLCIALTVFAVLVAGAGSGQAQPRMGNHDGPATTAMHQHDDCGQEAMSFDHCPNTQKHGATHGCCISACLTGFTTPEIAAAPIGAVSAERLPARADQAMASRSLDGLFKPPRRAA